MNNIVNKKKYTKKKFFSTPAQKKEFFDAVVANCNYMDAETVRTVYYAMVRAIVKGIKEKPFFLLPDLGRFELKVHKARRIRNISTKEISITKPFNIMRFYTSFALQEYLNKRL